MALYKRGKTWWMNFWFDGHHVQKSTKCKNKRDAEAIEHAYYTQLAKGEVGIEAKKTVPNFRNSVKDFLEWSKIEHAAKPNTYIRYETSTKALLVFFGDVRLDRVTPTDVEKFKVWRSKQFTQKRGVKPKKIRTQKKTEPKGKGSKKTISPATINRELACLKKIFNRLVKENVLISNPVSKVKFLAENNEQMRVLSYSEEKLYLMACSQPLQDFAVIMLETGMRPDEVRNLTVKDINLDREYLQVSKGKTKAARRKIPLSEIAFNVLESRIKNAENEYIFAGVRGVDKSNKPLVKLNNAHYGALNRSKVDKFRLYDLRHTFATRQAEAGTDLVTLASLLGHSRLEMVMRYAHPSENHKVDAIKRMEAARKLSKQKVA